MSEVDELPRESVEISPESTRKSGVKGLPFMLANGQFWDLATPTERIKPVFRDGVVALDCRWDYPAVVRSKVLRFIEAAKGDDDVPLQVIIDAAVSLVMMCHNLTVEQAVSLFELELQEVEDLAVGMLRMFRGHRPTATQEEPEPQRNE